MDVLNSIHKAISQLADILSGDDYVTISAVNPIVDLIEKSCLHPSQGFAVLKGFLYCEF